MKKKEDESLSETKRMLHFLMHPVEFRLKDVMQIIIGSAILAVPVGFTEETWRLGETLPFLNVFGLMAISILFISLFTYYHYYRNHMREHWDEFAKRVISTYLVAMIVVAVILALIQRTPWTIDLTLAFKRIVIVAFPASMSAAVADTIK
ncbi:DUF2391 family protein [Candidatus Woesearchaeota archaeon]|nr:DUF2391 family protein [Candidatus Woesearchaeota archaeon]